MKNFEKYEKELKNSLGIWFGVNTKTGKPALCFALNCPENCKFVPKECWEARLRWLFEEYKEPKTKGEQMMEQCLFQKTLVNDCEEGWSNPITDAKVVFDQENYMVRFSSEDYEEPVILIPSWLEAITQRGKELFENEKTF